MAHQPQSPQKTEVPDTAETYERAQPEKQSPEGTLEIPLGQKRGLLVKARSGGSAAVEVSPDRVEWVMSSDVGFDIKNGEIHAKAENVQIRLTAKYQAATSNEVRVSSVASPPLTLPQCWRRWLPIRS